MWVEGLGSENIGAVIGDYVQFYILSFLKLYASSETDYFGKQAIYAHFPSGMTNND